MVRVSAMAEGPRRLSAICGLTARYVLSRIRLPRLLHVTGRRKPPERIIIAPPDLRTGDSSIALDIYAGRFTLVGIAIDTNGGSVFEVAEPPKLWERTLHGFGWLRHLRAVGTPLMRAHARALIEEWASGPGCRSAAARNPAVVARRLISWMVHAPFLLDGADPRFAHRFLRIVSQDARRLERLKPADGAHRIIAAIALSLTGLCLPSEPRVLKLGAQRLTRELTRQIQADGGHISRNPRTVHALLLDLLPLRQTYAARNLEPPPALVSAIDRAMPMLRFFRLGNGHFASFNGSGFVPADEVAAILAFDDARGRPVLNASHSGYQRLEGGASVVVADTGPVPPPALSQEAHAGCLSFEFAHGAHRIVVNCGAPGIARRRWRQVARTTAAHSTAILNDTSSARFLTGTGLTRPFGAAMVTGPAHVSVERQEGADGTIVGARHDGYAGLFGLLHRREWRLTPDGIRLDGLDCFEKAGTSATPVKSSYVIRFHLHPTIQAKPMREGRAIVLGLPDGTTWLFSAANRPLALEESVFLADPAGPRQSSQIVLSGPVSPDENIRWSFVRAEAAPAEARGQDDASL